MPVQAGTFDTRLVPASEAERRWRVRELGLWMFLGTIVMLFAAFTSALVVRKSGGDWLTFELPQILWFNTAVIAVSSLMLEGVRRAGRRSRRAATPWVVATVSLGLVFLAGQVQAWRELVASGVFLPTNPSSGFFYILTGAHAVHMVAALMVLGMLLVRTVRRSHDGEWPFFASLASTFWHFLTVVWLYLFLILNYV
jgi:cytochrome c oxidase subunit 3